jgi:uncharacterized lipoprotein YbaY
MFKRVLFAAAFALMATGISFGQTSWLDRPLRNWNTGNGIVPAAPRRAAPIPANCLEQIRQPESLADRAVTRAGWMLFGPSQSFAAVTVITAMASVDGMCRPDQYNAFVFVSNRFAGTISPEPVGARADGSIAAVRLISPSAVSAEFNRYTSNDPLCCPSQKSTVSYSVSGGVRPVLTPMDVSTGEICQSDVSTMDNVVAGTITYRQRIALPPGSVVIVRIIETSRSDSPVIAEQRIETDGKQVPFEFGVAYDRSKIRENSRYEVNVEIRDSSGRLLFITDSPYPVITQGNPRNADIVVVPVGGTGQQRTGRIRGTVTYLQRSALPRNAEIVVRLRDSSDTSAGPVAEERFSSAGRQVPIPFELSFDPRDINRQRSYELTAEIIIDGRTAFRSDAGKVVQLRNNLADGIELTLQPVVPEIPVVTGRTISLSKFGTGTLRIEGGNSMFLIRASVSVANDGMAKVSLYRLDGAVEFTGKLIYFDETTLRIAVTSSGDADASGEIEIAYSGRSLRSLSGKNLILDGQKAELRF